MHCFLIHTLGCAALSASGGGGGAPTSAAALSGTTVSVLAVRFVLVFCACAAADVVVLGQVRDVRAHEVEHDRAVGGQDARVERGEQQAGQERAQHGYVQYVQ